MTQVESILAYLQTGQSITPREADELWGCMRLGARIYDLRRQGYKIISERESGVNRLGEPCHWARYRMGART